MPSGEKNNPYHYLMISEEQLQNTDIFVVWYEDQFQYFEDREPATVVSYFLTAGEVENYVASHEGPIAVPSGKFDGLIIRVLSAEKVLKGTNWKN